MQAKYLHHHGQDGLPANLYYLSSINGSLRGDIRIPGDKSISHRALILASLTIGTTKIYNISRCEDVQNTLCALRELGVNITSFDKYIEISGDAFNSINAKKENIFELHAGNSATTARMLMGLLAPFDIHLRIYGDDSLSARPMERITRPLSSIGVSFSNYHKLPTIMKGISNPSNINYEMEVPSAQVLSALMLASLNIPGKNIIKSKYMVRNHTEIMLKYLGYDFDVNAGLISIEGKQAIKSKDLEIAGDTSSAMFLIAAALLVEDSSIIIRNVCFNDTRNAAILILQQMGADIKILNNYNISGENIVDLEVKYSKLYGVEIDPEVASLIIDEYPILSVLCSFAEGKTIMRNLGELKIKESNRFSLIIENLFKIGINIWHENDDIYINGFNNLAKEYVANTMYDHRMVMSMLLMGLKGITKIYTKEIDSINNSFPEFFELLNELGVCLNYE